MFGTSGIRGIYGTDITETMASKLASIFAKDKLFLGRDIRESGPSLRDAIINGAGCEVIDLGIVPTPTVALQTKRARGIMITASHNPPEYNGLKFLEDRKEIGKDLEREITARYTELAKGFGTENKKPREKGTVSYDLGAVEKHMEMIFKHVPKITKKPNVIVDCNGAGAVITPYLLQKMGCNVLSFNASVDCFNRASEPTKESIGYLSDFIVKRGADFAVAHDGDADRCILVDDQGQIMPLDVQLAIMIEHELEKSNNKKIVSTVESSLVIREVVEKAGGKISITPVGSTYVGDEMERIGALFGGEPCGEYVYKDGVFVPDGILAVAKFVEIFCEKGKFSKLRKNYKQNFMAREKFPTKDKRKAIEQIKKQIKIDGKIRDDDGIRVDEEDGWFLIRASGTEPIIRLTMEYYDNKKLEKRKKELVELIRKNL